MPLPLPSRTLAVLAPVSAVTMSLLPSPFKSATATEEGPSGVKGLLGPKRAIAVAEQHARRVAANIRGYQVLLAIAVEVAHGDRPRLGSSAEVLLGLKRSVAVAEQNARRVAVEQTKSAATKSLLPSPLKSPTATEEGPLPVRKSSWPEMSRCRCRAARSLSYSPGRGNQVTPAVADGMDPPSFSRRPSGAAAER